MDEDKLCNIVIAAGACVVVGGIALVIREPMPRPVSYEHKNLTEVVTASKDLPVAFTGNILYGKMTNDVSSSLRLTPAPSNISLIKGKGSIGFIPMSNTDENYSMPFKLVNGKDTLDCYAGNVSGSLKKFRRDSELNGDSLIRADLAMRCAQGNGTPVTAKGVLDKNNQLRAYEVEISGKNYVLLSH